MIGKASRSSHYVETGEVGWDIVRGVHRALMIDDEFTLWHEDGFSWWSFRLAQRYRWEGPIVIDGIDTYFVSVETECLRGSHEDLVAFSDEINAFADVGAALVEGDRLRFHSRLYALPESAHQRMSLLAEIGILTNVIAHWHASDRSDALALDASAHPVAGSREVPDEMLTVVDRVYRPNGAKPRTAEQGIGLDDAIALFTRRGIYSSVGGEQYGATVAQWEPAGGVQAELAIYRGNQHPLLEYGMYGDLELRYPNATAEHARALNRAELTAESPLLWCGSWGFLERDGVGFLRYGSFHPNFRLPELNASLLCVDLFRRAEWAERVLFDIHTTPSTIDKQSG
jgi:hypothetical protein